MKDLLDKDRAPRIRPKTSSAEYSAAAHRRRARRLPAGSDRQGYTQTRHPRAYGVLQTRQQLRCHFVPILSPKPALPATYASVASVESTALTAGHEEDGGPGPIASTKIPKMPSSSYQFRRARADGVAEAAAMLVHHSEPPKAFQRRDRLPAHAGPSQPARTSRRTAPAATGRWTPALRPWPSKKKQSAIPIRACHWRSTDRSARAACARCCGRSDRRCRRHGRPRRRRPRSRRRCRPPLPTGIQLVTTAIHRARWGRRSPSGSLDEEDQRIADARGDCEDGGELFMAPDRSSSTAPPWRQRIMGACWERLPRPTGKD